MKQTTLLFIMLFSLVNLFAQNVTKMLENGNTLIEKGELDSAIVVFTDIIKIDKYHTDAHYNLGVCYMMKEDYNSSIPFFNKTILLDTNYHEARFNRAAAYSKTNNFLFAIFDYEYYIQKVPNDSLAYFNKSMVYNQMGEGNNALIELNKAINIAPKYSKAIYERSLIFRKQNKLKKALKDIETCLNYDYADSVLLVQQADIHFLLENYSLSDSFYGALYKKSNHIYFLEQMAFSRMYGGKNWPSLEIFAQLIKKYPKVSNYYYNRAVVYIKIDKNIEAENDLSVGIGLKPTDLGNYLNLRGITRYNQKKFNEACFDWEQASNLHHEEGKSNLDKYCEQRDE